MNLIQPGEQLVNIGQGGGWKAAAYGGHPALPQAGRAASSSLPPARLQPPEQLGAFFEDRQVGGEVGVEDGAEAQPAQGGHHLAGHQRAGRIAETFAQRRADGRRGLHDDVVVGLVERLPNLLDLVLLGDGADGADGRALAALHAGHGAQIVVERRADDGFEAAVLREQGADVLRFQADAHAAAALDALAAVAHQGGRRGVDPLAGLLAVVGHLADAQFGGQRLQFAVFVAVARLALAVVLREQQFDHRAARLADPAGVGEDLHPLADRHGAGGDEVPRPLQLDDAHAAGPDGLQSFDEAEGGDADAGLLRGRQDGGAFGHFDAGCC